MSGKLFKVWRLRDKKMVFASSLEQLISSSRKKLSIEGTTRLQAFLLDGTEVDSDEILQALDSQTILYILKEDDARPWEQIIEEVSFEHINSDPVVPCLESNVPEESASYVLDYLSSPGTSGSVMEYDMTANKEKECTLIEASRSSVRFKTFRKNVVLYPCQLPQFSAVVKRDIAEGTVNQNYGRFIRECAAFLLSLVEEPTKSDYDNFCRTLSEKYSFLNVTNVPGVIPYSFFKKSLSHSIRNARYYSSHKGKQKAKDAAVVNIIIDSDKNVDKESEILLHNEELVKSLKKKIVDSVHIEELMKITAAYRRQQILSSSLQISELQEKFPALKLQEWILCDFSLITSTTLVERKEIFLKGLESLKKMKSGDNEDDNCQLLLFKWLEKKIAGTKNVESCMTLSKVGDPVITSCSNIKAPHLVVYLNEDGSICAATILAQGSLICKLNNLCIFSIFDTLLAVYHIFDLIYPKAYINFLTFLQTILLNKLTKNQKLSVHYIKFMKEFARY